MDAELKECPFCGCMPDLQEIEAHTHNMKLGDFKMPDHRGCFTLECPTPGCCAMIADAKAEIIKAWNRRAIAPPVDAGSVDTEEFKKLLRAAIICSGARQESCDETLVAYIDAWGAQQREVGKAEEKAFIKECMDRGQDEFNRKWTEQKERAEKAEEGLAQLQYERDNLQKLAISRRAWAEKAEAELAAYVAQSETDFTRMEAVADQWKNAAAVAEARVKELEEQATARLPFKPNDQERLLGFPANQQRIFAQQNEERLRRQKNLK